ncbi:MAG: hypothetical protein LBS99_02115 [Clostridiales bacterium]|jgi:hypothetical protein|nr:hypothetical protein [Clostridiales bacterium]
MSISITTQILLAHVAYMKEYRGITSGDEPFDGGSYPASGKGDVNNFLVMKDGRYYGFVEPNSKNKKKPDKAPTPINIKRLGAKSTDIKIDDVCVVFFARDYTTGTCKNGMVIVGCYLNGTVYKDYQSPTAISGHGYNLSCDATQAFLFAEQDRKEIMVSNTRPMVLYGFLSNTGRQVTTKKDIVDLINRLIQRP